MKLAVIENTFASGGYHMALGQELVRDKFYRERAKWAHEYGDFIIVDNGAAEPVEERVNFEKILPIALSLADEIIMPDVLGERKQTIEEHAYWAKWIPARMRMIVPQGKDPEEWLQCFMEIEEVLDGDFASVGIPKICEKFIGGRVGLCERIRKCCSDKDYWFHALGVYRDPIAECEALSKFDFMRGIDTGAPVAWAQHGKSIMDVTERYSLEWNEHITYDQHLLRQNYLMLREACNAHSA